MSACGATFLPDSIKEIVMKKNYLRSVLCFTLALVSAATHAAPNLSLQCIGPQINPKFERVGKSEAVSELVQVNVGTPATPGSIWANVRNDAICTATIGPGYRFTSGRALRDDTNTAGFNGVSTPARNQVVKFRSQRKGNQMIFTMHIPPSPLMGGTANFRFYVRYKKKS
jgi:hypothetical protein